MMFKKKDKPKVTLVEASKKTEKKIEVLKTSKRKYEPDYPTLANMENETKAAGKTDFVKFLNGEHLNLRESISAKCYECMAYYVDGIGDCGCKNCPLYPFHPYNPTPAKLRKERPEMRKKK
jgi:hypothetical protein